MGVRNMSVGPGNLIGTPTLGKNDLLGYDGTKFVSVPNKAAFWLPAEVIDETTFGRASNQNQTLTTGTLFLAGNLLVPAGVTSLGCSWQSGGTASEALTHFWACLVDLAELKVRAVSADTTSGEWKANEIKSFTWETPYKPTVDTAVYAGILVASTKTPTLAAQQAQAVWSKRVPSMGGASTGSLTTPLTVGTAVTEPSGGLTVGLPIVALK